ncbi:high mobility group box domain-containing protein [Fennellomyces sp. T-0311]|nr:high mobility group box domain-containing protein [Fennellomyces sp. T-0311]
MFAITQFVALRASLQQRTYVSVKHMRPKKFKSILDQVPPRPRSGWQVFIREHLKDFSTPNGKINVAQATKELSTKWRAMSETEKQVYMDLYKKEATTHQEAYEKALSSASPQQLYEENLLRKRFKLKELPDPNVPKRPAMNGYMYYLKKKRTDPKFTELPLMEQSSIAAKEYRELPDSEKKVYMDIAKDALTKYHHDKAEYTARMTGKQ